MRCRTARVKALLRESGELGRAAGARLARHLANCAACRSRVDQTTDAVGNCIGIPDAPAFETSFRAALRRVALDNARRSPWFVPVPIWGATAVAAVVVALFLFRPPLPATPKAAPPAAATVPDHLSAPAYPSGAQIDLDLRALGRRIFECAEARQTPGDYVMQRVRVEGAIRRLRVGLGERLTSNPAPGTNETPNPSGGTS